MDRYQLARNAEIKLDEVLDDLIGNAAACSDLSTDQWLDVGIFKEDVLNDLKALFSKFGAVCPECECIGYHNHEQRGV